MARTPSMAERRMSSAARAASGPFSPSLRTIPSPIRQGRVRALGSEGFIVSTPVERGAGAAALAAAQAFPYHSLLRGALPRAAMGGA
jgi:hypothetical protein